ncbi:MAG: hypothetical protein ACP5RX_02610 [Minisyncoccia bacterium]
MEIKLILLQNFNDELITYLEYNRHKEGEYDRRNYFSSKVLFGWFSIKPEHIDYEKEKRDL